MSATTTLLADRFEEHRTHLKAVAYRLLGSLADADDAVQEAWLRLSRSDAGEIENLGGWLTTVVSRICLDMLRSRQARHEAPLNPHLPDPIVTAPGGLGPEDEAVLADAVGLALQVVLDRLKPAERFAFVLHDMFGVPFDFDALVAMLDPDVVLHADGGETRPKISVLVKGAATIAKHALVFQALDADLHPVLVNGAAGALVTRNGQPITLVAFTVRNGRIVRIDILADPARLAAITLRAMGR